MLVVGRIVIEMTGCSDEFFEVFYPRLRFFTVLFTVVIDKPAALHNDVRLFRQIKILCRCVKRFDEIGKVFQRGPGSGRYLCFTCQFNRSGPHGGVRRPGMFTDCGSCSRTDAASGDIDDPFKRRIRVAI